MKAAARIEQVAYCPAQDYKIACVDSRCHARHDRKLRACVLTAKPMAMACVVPPDHPVALIAADAERQRQRIAYAARAR
jgi:hypothetical protein